MKPSNIDTMKESLSIIAKLRDPDGGCPWDLEQTHRSLIKYLREESFEVIKAIEDENFEELKEELGDLTLQILLHSQIASESKKFDFFDVLETLNKKMIHRHPHVFKKSDKELTAAEVSRQWQELKRIEKKNKPKESLLLEKYLHRPALDSAEKIGEKSAEFNFDWDHIQQVFEKVEEEFFEVKEAWNQFKNEKDYKEKLQEEIGDLFFSLCQLTRHLGMEAEQSLRLANIKFLKRLTKVDSQVKSMGKEMNDLSTNELEEVWQAVKKE